MYAERFVRLSELKQNKMKGYSDNTFHLVHFSTHNRFHVNIPVVKQHFESKPFIPNTVSNDINFEQFQVWTKPCIYLQPDCRERYNHSFPKQCKDSFKKHRLVFQMPYCIIRKHEYRAESHYDDN